MDKPELMYLRKRIHDGAHNGKHFVNAYFSAFALQILFERHAVEKFHDDISRAVRRKEVADIDHARKVFNLGERARFLYKPFKTAVARGLVLLGVYNDLIVARDARNVARRKVFFKRDFNTLL